MDPSRIGCKVIPCDEGPDDDEENVGIPGDTARAPESRNTIAMLDALDPRIRAPTEQVTTFAESLLRMEKARRCESNPGLLESFLNSGPTKWTDLPLTDKLAVLRFLDTMNSPASGGG